MNLEYRTVIYEDTVRIDDQGNIIHSPLNGWIKNSKGRDINSYGYLSFGGHNLAHSHILSDVKVFHVEFLSDHSYGSDRERWADSLRVSILKNIQGDDNLWYLAMTDSPLDENGECHLFPGEKLPYTIIQYEKPPYSGSGFMERMVVEVPKHMSERIISSFFERAIPGYPIEGYCMPAGEIYQIRRWNSLSRDDKLFKEIFEHISVAFYTYPDENRHFAFLTNKYSLSDFIEIIRFDG